MMDFDLPRPHPDDLNDPIEEASSFVPDSHPLTGPMGPFSEDEEEVPEQSDKEPADVPSPPAPASRL